MTHAELRARLRAYADGTLVDADAETVRAHLASGCEECLREVFDRPVGLPRPRPMPATPPRRLRTIGVVAAAAGLGMMVGAVVAARKWARPATDDAALRNAASELSRLRTERSTLGEHVKSLESEVADAAARTHDAEVALERSQTRLADVERRMAPGTGGAEALTDSEVPPAWLDELLASTGVRSVPLRASPIAPAAGGYALWSAERRLVVIVVTGLPRDGDSPTYRVRVSLDDGSTIWVGDLGAGERGGLAVTIGLPEAVGRRVSAVELYRDPPGAPALTARFRS